ncbi:ABC transporter ATP-binding protein [Candidatus Chloroploca asiatica]|uniref:ABC transporter n=1 Tax=Candidatus Chloroploca asiatica TaxID=1506545 RepID=A0A2H3KWK9_9CHLR|nr:ATP-binding cassette domain-containing protein [Candidatus Chloroploca asiatica]PDV98326.1 ABC transporter [Candidatus Chloroploca asiatica]
MHTSAIHVNGLTKVYHVPERQAGLLAAMRSLVQRKVREVHAVENVSFSLAPGEIVGFLGPNGAGKTTTLKMLSGLLFPSGGEVSVLGHVPSRREAAYLKQITLVMGNRNQLQWDLPALDSFELQRAIYRIPTDQFQTTRDEFIEMMEVGDLVRKPVRNLSLGERMKMEIIGALLHRPQVLFLDEPTLGLDVTMQRRIRSFVADYNRRHGATVMLTSHYMADVEALCRRVIVIHHGKVLYDGALSGLVDRFAAYRQLGITLAEPADLGEYGEVVSAEGSKVVLRVPRAEASRITARLLANYALTDLTIEEPPIDDVIAQVFATEADQPAMSG